MKKADREARARTWESVEKEHINKVHRDILCPRSTYQHLIDSLARVPGEVRFYVLKCDGTLRHALRTFILTGRSSDMSVGFRVICAKTGGAPRYEELCDAIQYEYIAKDVAALMRRSSLHETMQKAIMSVRADILRVVPHIGHGYVFRVLGGHTRAFRYAADVARIMCSSPGSVHTAKLAQLAHAPVPHWTAYTFLAIDYVALYTLFGHTVATLRRRGEAPVHRLVQCDGDYAIAHRVAQFTLG
jgi:hypothetical protein